jgi:hypothetical protein
VTGSILPDSFERKPDAGAQHGGEETPVAVKLVHVPGAVAERAVKAGFTKDQKETPEM